jgi:HSP20 family protein
LSLLQGGQGTRNQAVIPAIDVSEDESSVNVTAELPGIDAADVDISVQGDMLEIRGQKREEQRDERDNYVRVERSYGEFLRRIALPTEVDSDQAEARMQNGVLTLRLPKVDPQSGRRTIQIEGSGQRSMGIAQQSQHEQGSESSEFSRASEATGQGGGSSTTSGKSSRQSGR